MASLMFNTLNKMFSNPKKEREQKLIQQYFRMYANEGRFVFCDDEKHIPTDEISHTSTCFKYVNKFYYIEELNDLVFVIQNKIYFGRSKYIEIPDKIGQDIINILYIKKYNLILIGYSNGVVVLIKSTFEAYWTFDLLDQYEYFLREKNIHERINNDMHIEMYLMAYDDIIKVEIGNTVVHYELSKSYNDKYQLIIKDHFIDHQL